MELGINQKLPVVRMSTVFNFEPSQAQKKLRFKEGLKEHCINNLKKVTKKITFE